MQRIKYPLILFFVLLSLGACGTPKHISYFQDILQDSVPQVSGQRKAKALKLQSGDRLSVIVSSKDLELANLFNLPIAASRVGANSFSASIVQNQGVSTYVVDAAGNIDFPQLGTVPVKGKDRHEIAEYIKSNIIRLGLVKDPVVVVELLNVSVSVMGEVTRPGRYAIDRDRMTVLDVLSMAGDLTIYGKRENVLLIRHEEGVQKTYHLDLRSGKQLFESPAYYVQQDDVIYVEPNKVRARQSTVNGNNVLSTSFWISVASLATSVGLLLLR